MENIILHSTSLKEFQSIIGQIVREELQQFKPEQPKQTSSSEYLTRKEVCNLLRVSLSTLHYYSKDGTLQSYRVGGRVLYKSAEVQQSITTIQANKYKHGNGQ
jgi:excisionase family DNA binding protein